MRYALTLWFIDSNERNQRILLDQQQQRSDTHHERVDPSEVNGTEAEKEHHLTLLSSLDQDASSSPLSSSTYRIQYPSHEDCPSAFQNSQLDVSPTEIRISSSSTERDPKTSGRRISEFSLPLTREIFPHQTIAKYSKRTGVLSLTVFYNPSV
jgi:hypothetical protein